MLLVLHILVPPGSHARAVLPPGRATIGIIAAKRQQEMKRTTWQVACLALLLIGSSLTALLATGARKGQAAETFRAMDLQGNEVVFTPGEGRHCLLLFFCMCADCHTLARQLARSPGVTRLDLQVIGVVHATRQGTAQFRSATGFPGALLADPEGEVHARYRGNPCPTACFIDPGGTIHIRKPRVCWGQLSDSLGAWPL
jgi:hypothetical protein